jgi:hypothetical protein
MYVAQWARVAGDIGGVRGQSVASCALLLPPPLLLLRACGFEAER